jgi:hypothetical protein
MSDLAIRRGRSLLAEPADVWAGFPFWTGWRALWDDWLVGYGKEMRRLSSLGRHSGPGPVHLLGLSALFGSRVMRSRDSDLRRLPRTRRALVRRGLDDQ